MSTHALDEGSKNTLELFVERTEALAQFVSENKLGGGLVGIFRNVNEREWQIHSAINGSLCILRSFLQSSDGIALYLLERDSPQGPLRRPKLLDLNVSASWHDTVNHAYERLTLSLPLSPITLPTTAKLSQDLKCLTHSSMASLCISLSKSANNTLNGRASQSYSISSRRCSSTHSGL